MRSLDTISCIGLSVFAIFRPCLRLPIFSSFVAVCMLRLWGGKGVVLVSLRSLTMERISLARLIIKRSWSVGISWVYCVFSMRTYNG